MVKALLWSAALLLTTSPVGAVSESSSEPFDFRTTGAIYHMVEGGGIIYLRPEEYFEYQGFILIYEALDQYLAELNNPSDQNFMHPGNLPLVGEFVFANGVAEKRYLLKEYWLGDGERWVPMSHGDYTELRRVIDKRRAMGGNVTGTESLSEYTAKIHEAAQNGDPVFEWQPDHTHQKQVLAETPVNEEKLPRSRSTAAVANIKSRTPKVDVNEEARGEKQPEDVQLVGTHSTDIGAKYSSRNRDAAMVDEGGRNASPTHWPAIPDQSQNGKWGIAAMFSLLFLCCFLYVKRKSL